MAGGETRAIVASLALMAFLNIRGEVRVVFLSKVVCHCRVSGMLFYRPEFLKKCDPRNPEDPPPKIPGWWWWYVCAHKTKTTCQTLKKFAKN